MTETVGISAPRVIEPGVVSGPASRPVSSRFRRLLIVGDAVVILVVIATLIALHTGASESALLPLITTADGAIVVVAIVGWLLALGLAGSRSPRIIGIDNREFGRVILATCAAVGAGVIAAHFVGARMPKFLPVGAFLLGAAALVSWRLVARRWLSRRRRMGQACSHLIVVGSRQSVDDTVIELARAPEAGQRVVATATFGDGEGQMHQRRSTGSTATPAELVEMMDRCGADTVVVTHDSGMSPNQLRRLAWLLEPSQRRLVIAPGLTDVHVQRMQSYQLGRLPLLEVSIPRYNGARSGAKRTFDVVAATVLVIVLSPILLAIAIAVKLNSPGPVLFRQIRVGRGEKHFRMLKFRSMFVDAEAALSTLQAMDRAEGNIVMFKMKSDPRVTSVGRTLRRLSLDELPQLFNVIGGSMSLVGPRPPLPSEVAHYDEHVRRRFLVKPGLTGLWQVHGRSDLDWEETVRLDLYYVENWSLKGDLGILARTARVVVEGQGAY